MSDREEGAERMSPREKYDHLRIWRCPQLGGPVPFKYCRRMNMGLPCPRIFDCWGAKIDVEEYLTSAFSEEELEKVFGGERKGRVDRILETLRRVRREREE